MSGSVNKVILIGCLGRDPEVRRTTSGNSVVTFSIATSDSWRDKATGERKDRTEWHNVVIFNENIGKIAEQYCKKGSRVYVEGKMRTRAYTDKDGAERRTTEIVLENFNGELTLLSSNDRPAPSADDYGKTRVKPSADDQRDDPRQSMANSSRMADIIDDDIPF
jgi:single-strand DNA-binding protein